MLESILGTNVGATSNRLKRFADKHTISLDGKAKIGSLLSIANDLV